MTERTSPRTKARIAGVFDLITIGGGVFAQFFVAGPLIVSGDPAATASHIMAAEPLYRLGMAVELAGIAAYIGFTALMYGLLKPVSRELSLLAAFFSLVGLAVGSVNLASRAAPLVLLGSGHVLSALTPDQLQALSFAFLRMQAQANNIGLICFGFYCALIGWLVMRSTFVPRLVGALMGIAGISWLINGFVTILSPPLAVQIQPIVFAGIIGEASLCLWLIVVGVNTTKWKARAIAVRDET